MPDAVGSLDKEQTDGRYVGEEYVFRCHRALGTVVDVRVDIGSESEAHALNAAAITEIDRLENVFSLYRPKSELNRWKRGEVTQPSDEFCDLMAEALVWQSRSGGLFNAMSGVLTNCWEHAERTRSVPSRKRLRAQAESIKSGHTHSTQQLANPRATWHPLRRLLTQPQSLTPLRPF